MIEAALPSDHLALTQLTKRSKAHWGYSAAQLRAWESVLTISAEYIEKNKVFKYLSGDEIVAYYAYFLDKENNVLLDNLFVAPSHMGLGFGKLLMLDFLDKAKMENSSAVKLFADPNAEQFYLPFGFKTIGQEVTSIPGRYLPVMIKELG